MFVPISASLSFFTIIRVAVSVASPGGVLIVVLAVVGKGVLSFPPLPGSSSIVRQAPLSSA